MGKDRFSTWFTPRSGAISTRLRDNNFDAMRLIFSSMVVMYHTGLLTQAGSLGWTSRISATFAVQSFFVVSGFLVTMSYENSSSLKSYLSKRFRRIAPAYVFVVLAAAASLCSLSALRASAYFHSTETWRYLCFNLLLSNFSAPTLPGVFESNFMPAVNGSLWTIKIEVAFYCLVPFMVMAARRFGPMKVAATVFIASLLWKIGFDVAAQRSGSELLAKLSKQLPGQLSYFAGGAWAYYRTRGGEGLVFLAALAGALIYASLSNALLLDLASPLCVTAMVYWAAIMGPRLPAAARYGDFSYSIYLYHFPIIQSLIALGIFGRSALAGIVVLIATLAICALFSWNIIEQPILHRGAEARSRRA